tara:strand:+ start:596 stop:829 length:234 start_codon:yes stop_codon:yes gene_type:complete
MVGVENLLSLRYQYEELVRDFKLSSYHGDIDSLKQFISVGIQGNRFRKGYDKALELANMIVGEYEMGKSKPVVTLDQ